MKKYFDEITENKLRELEITQRDFWNISRVTGEFLYTLIRNNNCKSGIEVGTSNGYSGIWLGKAFKKNCGNFRTIEFYDKRQSVARRNFELCGVNDVVIPLLGDAVTLLENLPEDLELDFAFIDANKREYIKYFKIIDKHMKVGGYITADNVLSHSEKTKEFIDAINSDSRYENVVLDLPAGLSVARKLRN